MHFYGPHRAIGIAAVLSSQPGNLFAGRVDIKELVVDAAIDFALHTSADQLRVLRAQIIAARPHNFTQRFRTAWSHHLARSHQLAQEWQAHANARGLQETPARNWIGHKFLLDSSSGRGNEVGTTGSNTGLYIKVSVWIIRGKTGPCQRR